MSISTEVVAVEQIGNPYRPHIQAPSANVLVVDDSVVNINAVKGLLSLYKIKADGAASGAEAVEKAMAKGYDLVLLDYMMPGMDGAETARELRRRGFTAESMPIISISSDIREDSVKTYLDAGMQGVLAKPLDAGQLENVLEKWLDKSKIVDCETARKKGMETLESLKLLDELDSGALALKAGESFDGLEKFLVLYTKNIPPILKALPQKINDGAKLVSMLNGVCTILENVCAGNLAREAAEIRNMATQNRAGECTDRMAGLIERLDGLHSKISDIIDRQNI